MMEIRYTPPRGLGQVSFQAMGTVVTALAPLNRLAEASQLLTGLFEEWEQTLSRFRPTSESSRLLASGGRWVKVSPLLYGAIATALDAARATRGLFDPTLGERMIQIGYDRDFAAMGALLPGVSEGLPAPSGMWRAIQLDAARRMVRLPRAAGLDFGGIGKGMAVDAALDMLEEVGMTPALVNAGGDLGVRGQPPDEDRWTVTAPGKDRTWLIGLERGALATSGVARRRWHQGDVERHHLIDPRTGEPAQSGLWSVTAVAGACAQAEVAAKVALLLGEERGAAFIAEARLGALLIGDTGAWSAAGAWPAGAMRPLATSDAGSAPSAGADGGPARRSEQP